MITCPDCNGRGTLDALLNRGREGCEWATITCFTCNGAGQITEIQAAAMCTRGAIRADRIFRDETIKEAADRLGMSLGEYSRMERG